MSDERPNWAGKICPYFSQATLAPVAAPQDKSVLVTGTMERKTEPFLKGSYMACQGPQCMKFVPMADETGKATMHGHCSDVLQVASAQQLNAQVEVVGNILTAVKEAILAFIAKVKG